ncbi:unnamed protein product, partial [Symbiodinium necroappetens]
GVMQSACGNTCGLTGACFATWCPVDDAPNISKQEPGRCDCYQENAAEVELPPAVAAPGKQHHEGLFDYMRITGKACLDHAQHLAIRVHFFLDTATALSMTDSGITFTKVLIVFITNIIIIIITINIITIHIIIIISNTIIMI